MPIRIAGQKKGQKLKTIPVRLTVEDYRFLEDNAEHTQVSMAEILRECARHYGALPPLKAQPAKE